MASYIRRLIDDMEEIDALTTEMEDLNIPWDYRESSLHGNMEDAINDYLEYLRVHVAKYRTDSVRPARKAPAPKPKSAACKPKAKAPAKKSPAKSSKPKSKTSGRR